MLKQLTTISIFLISLLGTSFFVPGVAEANTAPTPVDSIPDMIANVNNGAAYGLENYFSDADGDTLTYTGTSSDDSIVTASVSGATLTVKTVAPGSATITATAVDPDGEAATQTFSVTVPNRAPTTVGTISDQALDVGGNAATIDVSSNFSEPDGETLTYTATSSDEAIATVSVSSATVTVTAVAAGTATITVTATDASNSTANQTFSVTVTQPNRAPTAVGTVSDQALDVGGSDVTVDVSSNFSDADGDTLTYTATSSDEAIATVSVSSATVTVTPVAAGSATITVTATDPDGLTGDQTFSATVTQPNRAPAAVGTIADQALDVGGTAGTVDVSSNFSDADNDTLTYTAASSDEAVATVSVSGATVTITAVAAGTATITVTATDPDGETAEQTISVTVTQPNRAPAAVGTIADQSVNVGGSATTVDVSSNFSDADNDTLTYTATSSDTSIATVSVSSATVTITAVAAGTATITATATDPDGLTVDQTFSATVTQLNNAPTAVGTISDKTIEGGSWIIDVSGNFSDPDGDTLTYTATSSDTSKVTLSLSGASITITPAGLGTATVTVTATDPDGLTATQTFSVNATPLNDPPVTVGTMPDRTLYMGEADTTIDVSPYFNDPDGPALIYTARSSATNIVWTSLTVGSSTLSLSPKATGSAEIRVQAANHLSTAAPFHTFTATVRPANQAPVANGTIPDTALKIGGSSTDVDLSTYFTDGETLTYTATSSDTAIATVSVSSETLTVSPVGEGTATITATATDPGSLTANQTFSAVVTHPNRAPTAVGTPNGSVHGVGNTTTVNLNDYFSDPDGDTLTYTATSSDTGKATLRVSERNLHITAVAGGRSTITATATDPDGLTATQTFTSVVTEDIPDQTAVAGSGVLGISASAVVHFGRNPGDLFVYAATSSDTSVVTITTPHLPTFGNSAYLGINPVGAGTATVTAKLTYGNSRTSRSFTVTVFQGPSAIGTIPDQTLHYSGPDSASKTVDLSTYFGAYDTSTLTYSAVSSDTSKVTVSLSGATLTLTPVAAGGSSTITARATDPSTAFATQTFTATVKGPPTPNGTIPDQTLQTGGSAITINVAGYFIEPDGQAMTFPTVNDSFFGSEELVTPSISGSILTLTPGANPQNLTKSGTVTVVAEDTDGHTGVQRFTLTVKGTNNAPVASGTIPNITKKASDSATDVDLTPYFTDADGDTLTYTVISSDTAKATVSLSGATLTVTPVAEGTPTITATATDPSGAFATQTFTMTVNVANRAPVASTTIPNQTIPRVYAPQDSTVVLNLEDYFSDPDGDALTYSAPLNDTSKVVALNFYGGPTKLNIFPPPADANTSNSGTGSITVTATDIDNASVSQTFSVTTSIVPATVGTISTQAVKPGATSFIANVPGYFKDADGDTLSYSVSSSDESVMTVGFLGGQTVTMSGADDADVTVTLTATDPAGFSASHSFRAIVAYSPNTVGTMSNQTMISSQNSITIDVSSYFSDPNKSGNGLALTYSASSADTNIVTVSMSGKDLTISASGYGSTGITVTATNTAGLSATQSFKVTRVLFADATPGLSSTEQLLLGQLLTYDTLIFNELHNGSDDANDWLELRNVSNVDIPLDNWQLTIQTGSDTAVISFPAGTVIPAGDVLLLTSTEMMTGAVVVEDFVLPQTEFALILRSPTAFGDLAGNYFQTQKERPETAPELTVDTVWERIEATTSGYRAEAWAASTHRNGLGSPGYRPSALLGDANHDGVVNILDLVLVASQFGTTGPSAADLNADNTVNIQDLVLVANALGNVAAAPAAKQPTAALVNTWLQLAQQNGSSNMQTSLPKGFSYTRGIEVLEQLARALTPETTALLANYPNPFNPETWIPYQLAKAADVVVTIYASDGNVVRTLALGHQHAGIYKNRSQAAYWDGKNELGESVASGLYFYTLTAGDFTATRRMLILK